jgi:hypothetical protein
MAIQAIEDIDVYPATTAAGRYLRVDARKFATELFRQVVAGRLMHKE